MRKPEARSGTHRLLLEILLPVSGFSIPEIEPRLFSFNSPHGAARNAAASASSRRSMPSSSCQSELTLKKGAIAPWPSRPPLLCADARVAWQSLQVRLEDRWSKLSRTRNTHPLCTGAQEIRFSYATASAYEVKKLSRVIATWSALSRNRVEWRARDRRYMSARPARLARFSPQAEALRSDRHAPYREISNCRCATRRHVRRPPQKLDANGWKSPDAFAGNRRPLKFLDDVGLEYLTLSRGSGTLSAAKANASAWPADRLGPDRRALCA